jgi:hypothetical protein
MENRTGSRSGAECLIACISLTCCTVPIELTPPRPLRLATLGIELHSAGDVATDIDELESQCRAREDQLQGELDSAKDTESTIKTIVGATTGGIGTVGAGIASGTTLAVESEPATAVGEEPEVNTTAPVTIGVVTAVLTIAGTIVTVALTPGKEEMTTKTKRIDEIRTAKLALSNFLTAHSSPDQWSDADKLVYQQLKSNVASLCAPPA